MGSNINHHLFGIDSSVHKNKIHSASKSLSGQPYFNFDHTKSSSGVPTSLPQPAPYLDDTSLKLTTTNLSRSEKSIIEYKHKQKMRGSYGSPNSNPQYVDSQSSTLNHDHFQNANYTEDQFSTPLKSGTQHGMSGLVGEFQTVGLNSLNQANANNVQKQLFPPERPSAPNFSSNNAIYSSRLNGVDSLYRSGSNTRGGDETSLAFNHNEGSNHHSSNFSKLPYSTGHSPLHLDSQKPNAVDPLEYNYNESSYHYQHWGMVSDRNEASSAASRPHPSTTSAINTINDSQNNMSMYDDYLLRNDYSSMASMENFAQIPNVKHHTASTTVLADSNPHSNIRPNLNGSTNYSFANATIPVPRPTSHHPQLGTSVNYPNSYDQNAYNQNTLSVSTPDLYHTNYTTTTQASLVQNFNNTTWNTVQGGNANLNENSHCIVNTADIKMLSIPELPPENNFVGQPSPNNQYMLPNIDHISVSLNAIPPTSKELKACGLPFGMVYTPLKKLENVPLICPKEITRCSKCLCYLNPFSQWVEPLTFVCVLCGRRKSLVPDNCVDMLNEHTSMQSTSILSYTQSSMLQIALTNATYELLAPPSFCKYPPKTPCYILLIDMTHRCVSTGYLELMMDCLSDKVLSLCPNRRCSIAFVGYNQFVHFFSIKNVSDDVSSPKTVHHVISDINSIHQPFEDELFIYPAKDVDKFRHFLRTLPQAIRSYVPTSAGACCMTNALKFCMNILDKTGGKIILFNGTPPTVGEGVVVAPNVKYEDQGESISTLPTSMSTIYKSIGVQAYKKSICIDFFYIGFESYSPLVEMISMVNNCGGTYKYFAYTEKSSQLQFANRFRSELAYLWEGDFTIDNLVAVRTSRGIEVESYYGNFMVESTGKLILPFINENTTITIKLEIDDTPFVFNGNVYTQLALFFTCPNGERRIRVTTVAIKVLPKNNPLSIFHGANEFTIAALIARFIYFRVQSKNKLSHIHEATLNSCQEIVTEFYEVIKTKFDGRNLLMHTNLQHLFCFVHSLLSHPSLSPVTTCMSVDSRISFLEFIKSCSVRELISRLYPKLYPLYNLENYTFEEVIDCGGDPQKFIYPLPPSAQFMYQQCAYLLDVGYCTFILIPKNVSQNFLKTVFNCDSFDELPYHTVGLTSYPNELSTKLKKFIHYIVNKDKVHPYPYFSTVIFKVNVNSICSFYNYLPFDRRPNKLASLNEFYTSLKEAIISKSS